MYPYLIQVCKYIITLLSISFFLNQEEVTEEAAELSQKYFSVLNVIN
jgi:hypothetical protein